jgi:3-hydroxyacyl-[acyl-carrier-protein] dehydratase
MPATSHSLSSAYGYPFVMVDRIESHDSGRRTLVASKCVAHNEPLLQGHFPGYPIFPGALLIECLQQASSLLMRLDAGLDSTVRTILAESDIKHMEPVYPGEMVRLETRLVATDGLESTFRVRAVVDTREVTKGQLVLRVLEEASRDERLLLPISDPR